MQPPAIISLMRGSLEACLSELDVKMLHYPGNEALVEALEADGNPSLLSLKAANDVRIRSEWPQLSWA